MTQGADGLFRGAFRGRRVLVTGHTGFKGSWLCLWLQRLGAHVSGYALPPSTEPSLFELAKVGESMQGVIGDVRDSGPLSRVTAEVQPEVVFHLAAQSLVRRSYHEPKETFDTNVGGTVNLLEAVRHTPSVKAAIVVTSDKCYENQEWVWGYRENDPMGGHDPYSASKGAAELVVAAYQRSFFAASAPTRIGLATVRAGNVIGGGDWAEDRILPDAVRAVQAGRTLELRNPRAVRPWQHVLEPLSGYLALASRLLEDPAGFSGPWNFGPAHGDVLQVDALAQLFMKELGPGNTVDVGCIKEATPHEATLLWLACDKALRQLAWQPVWGVETAVTRTAEWYRAVLSRPAGAWRACLDDFDAYEAAAAATGQWWAREGGSLDE